MTETVEPMLPNVPVYADRLLTTASDPDELEQAYADYICTVLKSPLWSAQQPDGIRIP